MSGAGGRRAVFLDRDGVIVVPEFRSGRSFAPRTLGDFRFYPSAARSLARLREAGFLLVVVTNQPDIGNGLMDMAILEAMHARMRDELPVDLIKACCHAQGAGCVCRKPHPGMLLEAAGELGVSLAESFMIGDRASDIAAGQAAGCRTVFVDLDYDERKPEGATVTVRTLEGATDAVLEMAAGSMRIQ